MFQTINFLKLQNFMFVPMYQVDFKMYNKIFFSVLNFERCFHPFIKISDRYFETIIYI